MGLTRLARPQLAYQGLKQASSLIHTCCSRLGDNKEWKELKRIHQEKEDRLWAMREKFGGAYGGNPGMDNSLRNIRDQNEVQIDPMDRMGEDVRELGLDMLESTDQYRHILELDDNGFRRHRGNPDPPHIIQRYKIKRKYFTHIEPMLLTWMEREVMKYLHKTSPQEWTADKLSECFPATKEVCRRIIKSKSSRATPTKIKEVDSEVRSNWKKLNAGLLEGISDEYMEHLKSGGPQLVQGPPLSSGAFHEVTQNILIEHQRSLAPPKPAVKGKFGKIYADYKSKLEASSGPPPGQLPDPDSEGRIVLDVKEGHLMAADDDFRDSLTSFRDPRSGTALINVQGVDSKLKKEGYIKLDHFRQKYLLNIAKKQAEKGNAVSKVYLDWLNKINQEESRLGSKAAPKLIGENSGVQNMLVTEEENSFRPLPKYNQPKEDQEVDGVGEQNPFVTVSDESPPVIEVKIDTTHEGEVGSGPDAIIQKGDCFYDAQGNFLHKVPGLLKYNRRPFLQ